MANLLASPPRRPRYSFSSDTWIYDIAVTNENDCTLPVICDRRATFYCNVFQGKN